jgi:hypothetical protein
VSPDDALLCPNCQANLEEFSETAVALKRFKENDRVRAVRVAVQPDACPACQELQGAYAKDQAPALPAKGCSHPNGCRCFYEPILEVIYP